MDVTLKDVHKVAIHLNRYIQQFSKYGDAHMVDYFVNDHWNHLLIKKLQNDLLSLSVKELRSLPGDIWHAAGSEKDQNSNCKFSAKFPSLWQFMQITKNCQLLFLTLTSSIATVLNLLNNSDKYSTSTHFLEMKVESKEYMCLKKSHEVSAMSPVIKQLCEFCETESVLDIGSGKGYLSSYLSLRYNLSVTGIESNESNSINASTRAKKYLNYWLKHSNNSELKRNIQFRQEKQSKFKTVTTNLKNDTRLIATVSRSVVVGLHTCGDLCSSIISLFVKEIDLVGLCVVGCCYHHNTEAHDSGSVSGFPMSSFCKQNEMRLGRTKRMLALQAPEKNSCANHFEDFSKSEQSLFYRAVLTVIMKEELYVDVERRDFQVGKTFSKSKNFLDYVQKCLKKLNIEASELTDETISAYFQRYQTRMKELVAFAAVRQIYAPVIECLILVDRFCYLLENATESNITKYFLTELFDPLISPRRFALIAVK